MTQDPENRRIPPGRVASAGRFGLVLGFVGVVVFAGTLPFTRLAVRHLDAAFVSSGRAALAGLLAMVVLVVLRRPLPRCSDLPALAVAALCLAVLFPLFTGLALLTVDASHGAVVLGALPLATAILSAILTGERPTAIFWMAAIAGAALVVGFALQRGGGHLGAGDGYLFAAVMASALGYVLSGRLTQSGLAGWEVISWALVIALPVTVPAALLLAPARPDLVPAASWIGFAYVTVMSQYLGFFAWNAGLALGGIARVSQVQLLQTFVTLAIAAVLNGERVEPLSWFVAFAVVGLIVAAQRARRRPA